MKGIVLAGVQVQGYIPLQKEFLNNYCQFMINQ